MTTSGACVPGANGPVVAVTGSTTALIGPDMGTEISPANVSEIEERAYVTGRLGGVAREPLGMTMGPEDDAGITSNGLPCERSSSSRRRRFIHIAATIASVAVASVPRMMKRPARETRI